MPPAVLDFEQRHVADALDRLGAGILAASIHGGTVPTGLYLHGSVGRGKTWLCDRFFQRLPITAKRRVHLHSFFQQLNSTIWQHRTAPDEGASDAVAPADAVESAIAALLDGVDLLYFDEFQVADPGTAALVHRVLTQLPGRGVTLLATSNHAPQDLLPGPFHHVFAAGIDLLQANFQIVELGGTTDYRRNPNRAGASDGTITPAFSRGHWLAPGTDAQLRLAGLRRPTGAERREISAAGHRFRAERASGRELWFRFGELCERDTSVADYLQWLENYDTWVLDGVPGFSRMSPQARQRFTNLVDVLCDRDQTLHVISEHPPPAAIEGEPLPLQCARTLSRLALLQLIHTQH